MQPPFEVTLIADDLACERGGRTLFEGLSLTLAPGEALLVSGPNGVGKTSFLRQIAGLLPPAAGRLSATGCDEDTPISELCHYVGHLNGAKSVLTVQENLAFWVDYLGGGTDDLSAALSAFHADQLAELPAGLLSAGQKRKLALSRLFAEPRPIWLLDEPSVSLDAASVDRLAALVSEHLQAGGIAAVSTHTPLDIPFAQDLTLDVAGDTEPVA